MRSIKTSIFINPLNSIIMQVEISILAVANEIVANNCNGIKKVEQAISASPGCSFCGLGCSGIVG